MSAYYIVIASVLYGFGWLVYVLANDPQDSYEGAICLVTGVIWPIFALGWLVSRA